MWYLVKGLSEIHNDQIRLSVTPVHQVSLPLLSVLLASVRPQGTFLPLSDIKKRAVVVCNITCWQHVTVGLYTMFKGRHEEIVHERNYPTL